MHIRHVCRLSGLAAVLTLLFGWHIFAMAVHNAAENPVSVAADSVVERYMNPLFTQSWSFFAPTPMTKDTETLYRIRYRNMQGRVVTSEWISLSESLNREVKHNPFSTKSVVLSGVFAAALGVVNREFYLTDLKSASGRRRLADPVRQPDEISALERTAMALVPRQLSTRIPYDLQIAVILRDYPRFTHRYEHPQPEQMPTLYQVFPWTTGDWITAL